MRKNKLLAVMSVAVISSTFLSCDRKLSEKSVPVPPTAETLSGEKISVPMGGYEIKSDTVPDEYAERICKAFGKNVSEDSLNNICFEENIVGVGLASVVYFGKYAEKLTSEEWEQFCTIAESYAENEDALIEIPNPRAEYVSHIPDSAYFDAMIENVVTDYCMAEECSRSEAFEFLYSGGVTVKTPYNSELQTVLDKVYADNSNFTDDPKNHFPQSACTILDYNGGVVAAIGGNNNNSSYNRSYRIPHDPGSAIKPVSVYAPALIGKMINFSSLIPDEPLIFEEAGSSYEWPKNYDGIYSGNITVTQALRKSRNAAAAQIVDRLTPLRCFDFLKEKFGITTLNDADSSHAAMSLGALENGVYLHELAAAYAVFGNGGSYTKPYFYTEVIDGDGNTVLKNDTESYQTMESDEAWIMNRLLYCNVNSPDGIAGEAAMENIEVIGKTGTSANDLNLDSGRMFIGAVPDYVTAVWIGYDDESSIEESSCVSPTQLWKNIVGQFSLENNKFTPDDTVAECEFCTVSGGLSSERCKQTETGYYTSDNMPDMCHECY
ncbi:MAG: hypothetical protein IJA12_01260 [Oscillospiraceae bacterium]|nr:hypothetical protein [Oscillospiraceae bacterium]